MFAAKNITKTSSPSSTANKGTDAFIQPKLNVGKPGDKYEVEADNAADQIVSKSKESSASFFPVTTTVQKQETQETEIQQQPIVDTIIPGVQLKRDSYLQKVEDEETSFEEGELQMMGDTEESHEVVPEHTLQTKEIANNGTSTLSIVQQMSQEDIQHKEEEDIQEKDDSTVSSSVENTLQSTKGGGSPMDTNTRNEMESGFGADFSNVNIHTDNNAEQILVVFGYIMTVLPYK